LDVRAGETAIPGAVIAAVADLSAWKVETSDLSENSAAAVVAGQRVKVTLDALPEDVFGGVVESVRAKGTKYQGDWVYRVTVRMDERDTRWLWNMTAKITVEE
jgi:HlyD family secretion protein